MQGLTLKEVTLTPAANSSLYSITNIYKEGWKLHVNYKSIWLTKGSRKVVFYVVINTPKGVFPCSYLDRNIDKVEAALDVTKPNISIHLVHEILGHMD